MTFEALKKLKLTAMKERETNAVSAYNAMIAKLTLMATDPAHGKEISELDVITAAKKTESELVEERANFEKAGRHETVAALDKQIEIVRRFIPAMMSEEKIKEIILSLPDKSLPAVMKHFKTNYAGQCDMKLVNQTLRNL